MPTINDLNDQIQKLQITAENESQQAQDERDKADQARASDDTSAMQSHLNASTKHDQRALQAQSQIDTHYTTIKQLQSRAQTLQEQRNLLAATNERELDRLDREIQQLTGN